MVKVFKSIMATLLLAVMICSCSNGSSGGGDSSDGNSKSSLVGTVWEVGGVYLYLYEDGVCSLVAGSAQPGTYDESTKTIHITSPVSIYYTYEISGDTMTISAGGESIDFKRQS
ncbi:hypothetical protein [uncultured Treponema sp.]|uniref:hypothetical protein n=1 Tax=uncultured Treponema sp. TaxID=162155 RepID=UPI00258A1D3D|nr:hypothetical protein [uncultured Treponema sp.]